MPKNLRTYSKLLVISDTGMFRKREGIYAFGPVVKELEALDCFDNIVWIGFNRPDQFINESYIKISDPRIGIKMLKRTGGKSLSDKFSILLSYPKYISILLKEIIKSDLIHVRAPSNPALITMILTRFFPKKQFWFKYAGDWSGEAPLFYKIQRMILKRLGNNSKVTVNGYWPSQPKNILAFENPCLDIQDRTDGAKILANKKLTDKLNYCFVGGLNENKGCLLLLQALAQMKVSNNFGSLHIVGEGHLLKQLQELSKNVKIDIIFHGSLAKDKVAKIYSECHFIILPSKSEGFPKVIGEAMNYGCVPIVSDISCIGQYVKNEKNGILIETASIQNIEKAIKKSAEISSAYFQKMVEYNYKLAERFTYKYYKERVIKEIFK